jgi:exodeoxyribonuclease VII small subunit
MSKEKDFEEMLDELETIVSALEKDDLKLDDAISLFTDGMKIAKVCNKKIEEAEKKITVLINENGNISEEDFVTE